MIAFTSKIEAQLVAGTWTDLSADVLGEVSSRFGIQGNGPVDGVASTGELHFDLDNSAENSGATLGWYSPAHASKRAGWSYGLPLRWVLTYENAASVTSITQVAGLATATTAAAHGRSTGDWVTLSGAAQAGYVGTFQITVTGASTFTFSVDAATVTPATGALAWVRAYVRFRGKVGSIMPLPGFKRERRVVVVGYDVMHDLMSTDIREVATQLTQTESQLLATLVNAMPTTAQPPATSFDTGVDTFPYAFDNIADGLKAGSLAADIVTSSLGALFAAGDGTLVYKNRQSRATAATVLTLSNDMIDLSVPSSLDGVYNHVRATIHPKTIDTAATTVLWAQTGLAPDLSSGESMTIWGTYYQASTQERLIGGTAQVTPIVATTDYTANSQADGLGADLTANVSVTTYPFASSVKFVVTNSGAATAYITKLQLRGKGVYDNGPRTFESYTAKDYGDHPVDIDLPYQDDAYVGQSIASYLDAQFNNLTSMIDGVEFIATRSATLMAAALTADPTNLVVVTETVTGLSATNAIVQAVELTMPSAKQLRCRFLLGPAAPFAFWYLGTAGASELGSTTVLGF